MDAEVSHFSLVLVQGKKCEGLDCAAHHESALGWAVPPVLDRGDRAFPHSFLFVPLILPSILPVTCRPQARGLH